MVATDDEKIAECCRGFGADVVMTSESCRNGKHDLFVYLIPPIVTCKLELLDCVAN